MINDSGSDKYGLTPKFGPKDLETDGGGNKNGQVGTKTERYFLPIDSREQSRLDTQHDLFLAMMDGKLGRAPVSEPRRVLDVATGTGIWALQYATANPSCQVIGTDISDMKRPHSLPNLSFHKVDAETEPWPCDAHQKYDYIYLRFVVSCFDSTQAVFRRAFEHLAPGGWIEIFDPCNIYVPVGRTSGGEALEKWNSLVLEGGLRVGRDLTKSRCYAGWLRDEGFVNVTESKFGTPYLPSAWGADGRMKELSQMATEIELGVVDGVGKFLRQVVADEQEARAIEEAAKRDLRNSDTIIMRETYNIYAQKPKEA